MIMQRKYVVIVLIISLMFIMCFSAWAETIRLKNGRIFEGIVADQSGSEIKILMKSGVVTFSRNEIASIGDRKISAKDINAAKRSLSSTAPAKKTTTKKPVKPAAKTAAKVKKPATPIQATSSETSPAVATDTGTAVPVSSAPVVAVAPVPAEPEKGLSLSTVAAIITVTLIVIALVVMMIKRKKKPPNDTNLIS